MLSGIKIIEEVEAGNITIDPFDINRVNPNSYNIRIAPELKVYRTSYTRDEIERFRNVPKVHDSLSYYEDVILDSHRENPTVDFIMSESGFMLQPGILYLGSTVEKTHSKLYVPCLSGRSSTGRLCMSVHVTAGFGDAGFSGTWTLEITVEHNLIIYPYDEIGQIYFEPLEGDPSIQYNGRYNNQQGVQASKFYL